MVIKCLCFDGVKNSENCTFRFRKLYVSFSRLYNYTKLSGLKDVSFSNYTNRIAKRTSDFLDASERNVMNVVCAPGTAAIVSSCRPAFCLRWRKLFRRACSGCLAVAFSGGARGRPVPGDYRICRRRGIGLWRYGFRIFPTDTELFGCAPPEFPGVSWIVFAARFE